MAFFDEKVERNKFTFSTMFQGLKYNYMLKVVDFDIFNMYIIGENYNYALGTFHVNGLWKDYTEAGSLYIFGFNADEVCRIQFVLRKMIKLDLVY